MEHDDVVDVVALSEQLHRQFLERIQTVIKNVNIRDINNVRAFILMKIGDEEMSASELLWSGCYLGTNISYNLKKLTETGYVVQQRSAHDRRVVMVRCSAKGADLCALLKDMNARTLETLAKAGFDEAELRACRNTLRALQGVWSRSGEAEHWPAPQPIPQADRPDRRPGSARAQSAAVVQAA
jgi:DNA-binding MarR family transcriptional regulator